MPGAIRAPPISTRWRSNARPSTDARALSLSSGLPDEAFQHDGQLTKREIRAATLSALRPLPGQLLWDVGAGCGSIAIEWLRTHRSLSAIAIESDAARQALIERNAAALGTPHLKLVKGDRAASLCRPARARRDFHRRRPERSGRGRRRVGALKTGGRLVANAVTVEGEAQLFALHGKLGGEMTRLSVARLRRSAICMAGGR